MNTHIPNHHDDQYFNSISCIDLYHAFRSQFVTETCEHNSSLQYLFALDFSYFIADPRHFSFLSYPFMKNIVLGYHTGGKKWLENFGFHYINEYLYTKLLERKTDNHINKHKILYQDITLYE